MDFGISSRQFALRGCDRLLLEAEKACFRGWLARQCPWSPVLLSRELSLLRPKNSGIRPPGPMFQNRTRREAYSGRGTILRIRSAVDGGVLFLRRPRNAGYRNASFRGAR